LDVKVWNRKTQRAKEANNRRRFLRPHALSANFREIRINLILLLARKLGSLGYIFAADTICVD